MTRLTSEQMPVPPPKMSVLWNGDERIGWTRGHHIGFTGFADGNLACAAAWIANVALARRRNRNSGLHPSLSDIPSMSLRTHNRGEWIWADDRALARTFRPGTPTLATEGVDTSASRDWWSIEIELPVFATELAVASSAHVIHRGLRRSGLPWAALDGLRGRTDLPSELRSARSAGPSAFDSLRARWRRLGITWSNSAFRGAFHFPRSIHFD